MINPKAILLTAGALFAYNAFAKGKALTTLNFYAKGVRAIRFDGVTPVMTIALGVQNTTGQNLILRSFAGNLFSNGYLIGNVSSYVQTAIRPNSESILLINARLSAIGIISNIVSAFNGNGAAQEVELDAKANVDNFQLPIKIKYKIGV